jgi:hypothetical protein
MNRFAKIKGIPIILFALFICVRCSLLSNEDFLPSEEARLEVRAANQKVTTKIDEIRNIPSMKALDYLTELLDVNPEKQLAIINNPFINRPGYFFPISYLLNEKFLHSFSQEIITEESGLYKFNFLTETFDLIDLEVDYLRYIFPSNPNDKDSLKITAAFTVEDVEYVYFEIAKDEGSQIEKRITRFSASFFLNKRTQMTYNYEASFSQTGVLNEIDIKMSMSPYQFQMNQSGNKQHYFSTMSMILGRSPLMSYSLNTRRAFDSDVVEKLSGNFRLGHIEWEGTVYSNNIKHCEEHDISCVNDQFNIIMLHTNFKKRIGKLEARLYYDSISGANYPELNLIYEDGSSDILSDVLEVGPNKLEYYIKK